jgi:hypothetical protein
LVGGVSVGNEVASLFTIAYSYAGVFLVQSIIIYTVGVKLWVFMEDAEINSAVSSFASFAVCVSLVAIASEIFYHLVDLPSIAAARAFWMWMIK